MHKPLRQDNYRFILENPLKTIEFNVQEFAGLGFSLSEIEQTFFDQTLYRPGATFEFNELSLTVLMDDKFETYKQVHDFLKQLSNYDNQTIDWNKDFVGFLYIYNNINNLIRKIKFDMCFIKGITDMQFMTTSSDEINVSATVMIKYNYLDVVL